MTTPDVYGARDHDFRNMCCTSAVFCVQPSSAAVAVVRGAMDGAFLDNEVLIAAVEQRPPLWMASHRQHKDKNVKAALWWEVAAAVLPGVNVDGATELVQKRWKSLRDKFRRLFVAYKKSRKSGAGLDDVESATITLAIFPDP
ncbi:hypothetical protein MTO96_033001 [Rhipicephalus appendiculatus]